MVPHVSARAFRRTTDAGSKKHATSIFFSQPLSTSVEQVPLLDGIRHDDDGLVCSGCLAGRATDGNMATSASCGSECNFIASFGKTMKVKNVALYLGYQQQG